MSSPGAGGQEATLGKALVDFALHGAFPEGDASSLAIRPEELPAAIEALAEAKAKLEARVPSLTI
jgi:centromere/kinetochore protein ZW10